MKNYLWMFCALLLVACASTTGAFHAPVTVVPTPVRTSVEFEDTSFSHDQALTRSFTAEIVPETDAPPGGFQNSRRPQHTLFTPVGYAHSYLSPEISVYSIADYEKANPLFSQFLPDLVSLLNNKPSTITVADKFRLPLVGDPKAQNRMRIAYFRFKNGSGVRFVTYYREIVMPLVNSDLRYIFQGITDDRKYYVLAVWPVRTPFLQDEWAAGWFMETNPDYVTWTNSFNQAAEQKIESLDVAAFEPQLGQLDDMVKSLLIR